MTERRFFDGACEAFWSNLRRLVLNHVDLLYAKKSPPVMWKVTSCHSIHVLLSLNSCPFAVQFMSFCRSIHVLLQFNLCSFTVMGIVRRAVPGGLGVVIS